MTEKKSKYSLISIFKNLMKNINADLFIAVLFIFSVYLSIGHLI